MPSGAPKNPDGGHGIVLPAASHIRASIWFSAANALFLLFALAVRTWEMPLTLAAVAAGVLAIPGLRSMRPPSSGSDAGVWRSRGVSWFAATMALSALHVALPYVAFGEGSTLWAETGYGAVGILLAGGGWLAWNAVLLQAELPGIGGRFLMGSTVANGVLLAWAFWLAATGADATVTAMEYADETVARIHNTQAPLLAAAPAALWAAAWLQVWIGDRRPE